MLKCVGLLDLMALLESRGLVISDEAKAVRYLESIGYYRLSAYMYPFLKAPKETHQYKDDTTFLQVLNLYRFDKKLRMLLLNEIEKVEIAIRRAIMNIQQRTPSTENIRNQQKNLSSISRTAIATHILHHGFWASC